MKTKKYRSNLVFNLFLSLTILACGSAQSEQSTSIKGSIKNLNSTKVYLDALTQTAVLTIDSIVSGKDGSFEFKLDVKEIGYYRVRAGETRFLMLILDTKEKIEISGDTITDAEDWKITGSEASKQLQALNKFMKYSFADANELDETYRKAVAETKGSEIDSIRSVLQNKYESLVKGRESYAEEFIDKNLGSFATLAAATYLSPETGADAMKKADAGLQKTYPNSMYVKDYHAKVTDILRLAPGSVAPEIEMNDVNGVPVKLSSLRGKYVMIDFWASWCGPCRQENPALVKVYQKFKSKGFQIYGVSLDNNDASWKKAIMDDNLTWVHVSDLQRWGSSVVKSYGVEGIPYSFLIDKEGKIIARGLRSEALEKKLNELLPD